MPWLIGLSRENLYLPKMQIRRPHALLTGSEALGWNPGICVLNSFPSDFWQMKALGRRLDYPGFRENYFQYLAQFLSQSWYSINTVD